jgi:carboxymethylenebutenolidase
MTAVPVKPSPEGVPGAVTDPTRILAEDLTFPSTDGTQINGYLARPAAATGPSPAMIVIHEAGGLGEHIRDVTDRFANIGYVALGVDLYTREGGPPPMGDMQALMARLFSMSDATVLGDLEGAADFLRARGHHGQARLRRLLHGWALHAAVRRLKRPPGRRRRLLGRLRR